MCDLKTDIVQKVYVPILKKDAHKCTICNKLLATGGKPVQVQTGEISSTFFLCRRCFRKDIKLQLVQRSPNERKCPICDKNFADQYKLKRHSKIHIVQTTPHTCSICNTCYTSSNQLMRHLRIHTKNQISCNICNQTFPSAILLNTHLVSHNGDTPHTCCGICKKSFASVGRLKHHALIHKKQISHVCERCDKRYSHADELEAHLLSHPEATSHQYDGHGKIFVSAAVLKFHKLIEANNGKHQHTDETTVKEEITVKEEPIMNEGCIKEEHKLEECKKETKEECYIIKNEVSDGGNIVHVDKHSDILQPELIIKEELLSD